MSRALRFFALTLFVALPACSGETTPAPTEAVARTGPVSVRVSSFPAEWLVHKVGGSLVSVENVLPVGEDPPYWAPSGDVVAEVQKAELIVANGAGFEKWMETATLPADRIVDTAAKVELIHIEAQTHSHGKGGEHSHAGIDPHTWSDPLVYSQQAEAVHAALVAVRPAEKAALDRNLAAVQADLAELDRALKDALTRAGSTKLSANHPAYNYIARRYGLQIHAFDFDPEEVPSDADRAAFVAWSEGVERPHHLLWESMPTDAVRRAFPAGTLHVFVDPLEQPPEGGTYDYLAQARKNVATFKALFSKPAPDPTKANP